MADDFFELYRRPEWQQKRLKVMEAAGFQCQECRSKDKTLNVHHRFYKKGAKPWEYPDNALICLCEGCHDKITVLHRAIKEEMGWLSAMQCHQLMGYLGGLLMQKEALNGRRLCAVFSGNGDDLDSFSRAIGLAHSYVDPDNTCASNILVELDDENHIDHQTMCTLTDENQEAQSIGFGRSGPLISACSGRSLAADCRA